MSDDKSPMWVKFPHIWSTQSKYMTWLRGGLRLGLWKKSPVKLEFLKDRTFLIDNTNPRSMKRFPKVKACRCEKCEGVFKSSEIEIDHIEGNVSLKSKEDILNFIDSIIEVDFDMLQLLCKGCHAIKTLADKNGISFAEAKVEKQVIEICKGKKDKDFLESKGIIPASNAVKRRQQVKEVLTNES